MLETVACGETLRTMPEPEVEALTAVPALVTVKVSVVGLTTVSRPVKLLWLKVGARAAVLGRINHIVGAPNSRGPWR